MRVLSQTLTTPVYNQAPKRVYADLLKIKPFRLRLPLPRLRSTLPQKQRVYDMDFKGRWYEKEIILTSVRWYLAYPLSTRHVEEMMKERGAGADHSTIHRWVLRYGPELEKRFRRWKKPVGRRWRMDETYVKVKGQWKYLYRAVDATGMTIDFLLTARRDARAARRFFKKSVKLHGTPEMVNIDKSGANQAGLKLVNEEHQTDIEIRQNKYMNNIVEQDHRGPKRIIKPTLGFKSFRCAKSIIAGIELCHMLRKGQACPEFAETLTPAEQFYKLAA